MYIGQRSGFSLEDAARTAEMLGVDWGKVEYTLFDLHKGMNVELEHGSSSTATNVTDDDAVATAKIALAHLNEGANYYELLEELEKKLVRPSGALWPDDEDEEEK